MSTDNADMPVENMVEQEEAQERLALDPLPDFVDGITDVHGVPTQSKLYKHFFVYCDRNGKQPSVSYNVCHLATGKTVIVHNEIEGGLNERQAKRLATWLAPLNWNTDANNKFDAETDKIVGELVEAYSERDWISVEKIVNAVDSRRLVGYDSVVKANSAANKPEPENTMSATGVANGVASELDPAGEQPKRRGRKKRDPNSKAAIARPGILMKPVAGFCDKEATQLAQLFGEKTALVYATGVYVLSQLPEEQQLEAFKQAKLQHVRHTKAEMAKQGSGDESAS